MFVGREIKGSYGKVFPRYILRDFSPYTSVVTTPGRPSVTQRLFQ